MTEPSDDVLSERAQHLLRVLVESYIREGQPVGSRSLTRDSGLQLSSATVRNVMADLEEYGFVTSPHTSAGRVPTDKGYRFFVDTPAAPAPAGVDRQRDERAEASPRRRGEPRPESPRFGRLAGAVVADAPRRRRHHSAPAAPGAAARSSSCRFPTIVCSRSWSSTAGTCRTASSSLERHYTAEELRRAANFLNQQFGGKELTQIRSDIVSELTQTRATLNQLMLDAIKVAQQVVGESSKQGGPEYCDRRRDQPDGVCGAVERRQAAHGCSMPSHSKRDILHLLDLSLGAEGVQIFIGQESGYEILDDVSLGDGPVRARQ